MSTRVTVTGATCTLSRDDEPGRYVADIGGAVELVAPLEELWAIGLNLLAMTASAHLELTRTTAGEPATRLAMAPTSTPMPGRVGRGRGGEQS